MKSNPTIGSYWMPEAGQLNSAIRCVASDDKGFQFKRCHLFHNGEVFFLNNKAWQDSKWIEVPVNSQLVFC